MYWQEIEKSGGLAVITGGASGVGYAAAAHLAALGFDILLADVDEGALQSAFADLQKFGTRIHTMVTDVSDIAAVQALADTAFGLGPVAVVMNNAGIGGASSTLENHDAWRKIIDVNLYGVLNGVQAFVPRLIEQGKPAAVINTGSKQGITNPPGNPAYNVSKAAVKALTEHLSHDLREQDAPIDVHLFVPGFTYTGMIASFMPEKPQGAWTSDETIEHLFKCIARGDFYVMCPDNMVTAETDAKRVLWNAQDIIENRPALSRWHPKWKAEFAKHESDK
ncbi:MAG: SDR family NAD(P)-dependent oxidoreductase [Roseobacter sp.]